MSTWTYLRRNPVFAVAVLGGLAAAVTMAGSAWQEARTERFLSEGARAEARITAKDRRSRRGGRVYSFRYAFDDGAGARFDGRGPVPEAAWKAAKVGDRVTLVYPAHDPRRGRLLAEVEDDLRSLRSWFWIGAGGTALAAFLLLGTVRAARRRVELVETGRVTLGRVTEVVMEKTPKGQSVPNHLRFEFLDDMGTLRQGRSPRLPAGLRARWKKDDGITVTYDPSDRSRCEADVFDLRGAGVLQRQPSGAPRTSRPPR
jgi:hypothetical protein